MAVQYLPGISLQNHQPEINVHSQSEQLSYHLRNSDDWCSTEIHAPGTSWPPEMGALELLH